MLFRAFGIWFTGLCTVACCLCVSDVHAQQPDTTTPPAPRLFRPRARALSGRFVPRTMRPAVNQVFSDAAVIGDGAFQDQPLETIVGDPVPQPPLGPNGHVIGGPPEQIITDGYCGDCGGCGDCYDSCYGCSEIDCRDCGIAEDCWMRGLGGVFYNSEYFWGVQAFAGQGFQNRTGEQQEPASFGYQLGFNTGLPLYRVTCGLVSGQFGVRTVQSNTDGDFFSADRRDQTFITAGLYRRVDYGLQFGVVADILNETWLGDIELVQVRSDVGYVWPSGHIFGFRAYVGVQDDRTAGLIDTVSVAANVIDTYRFYFRRPYQCGGYTEWFLGWSTEQHSALGVQHEIPLGECTALQTGFTYLGFESDEQQIETDAWNIGLGVSYRPRGRGWYKFYHRPMFPVADNGSLFIRRFDAARN